MTPRKVFHTAFAAVFLLSFSQAVAQEEHARRNRLANEKSPHLIKHSDDPVQWYPWGEEAFKHARMRDKPVFLSIGYLACRWCEVMRVESFSDPEVAALMNEVFVSVKVDRDERPDIDGLYTVVSRILTGGAGWPLNVIMTPDGKPFFAGTYIPKRSGFGRVGMMRLIPRVKAAWDERRSEVLESADMITALLREATALRAGGELDESVMSKAYMELSARFDEEHGGFGQGVKFPAPNTVLFLLRYWKRTGNERALQMAAGTLASMRQGGIYDHLGFGFHRYSTDPEWLLPHFEKMLYDQALLAMAYTEAYQATGREEFASTAKEIFTYVLRDLSSHEGGFYSAQGADSGGEEGTSYLWTMRQMEEALGEEGAKLAAKVFDVRQWGNFRQPSSEERAGLNVLRLRAPVSETAGAMKMPEKQLRARLDTLRAVLFEARLRRGAPETDDKVLADWNGLMIAALAKGGRVFREPAYSRAAGRAADFILGNMRDLEGGLLHRWREGHAAYMANAEDYAFLIWGLIELYQTGFDVRRLEAALELTGILIGDFWDGQGGGFYSSAPGDGVDGLIVRMKGVVDGARPSANSVAMLNLLRLGGLIASAEYEDRAARIAGAFAGDVWDRPLAHAMFLSSLDFMEGPSYEVVVVGDPGGEDTRAMLRALQGGLLPNVVVLLLPAGPGVKRPPILRRVGYIEDMGMVDGKAAAYVCENHECSAPTTEPRMMLKALGVTDSR
jgi:uncharacterized protein YyaL (SSP411 family)